MRLDNFRSAGRLRCHYLSRKIDFGAQADGMLAECYARSGECGPARRPREKLDTEFRFKSYQSTADDKL